MCGRTRSVFYLGILLLPFSANSIDLSDSYVTFYEGSQMSEQNFLYPILKEKGTQNLTYLDDLILDSLRGGRLGYQYFDSGGDRVTC